MTKGFRAGGGVGLIKDRPQLSQLALEEAQAAAALLAGRRSYEWLARRSPSRAGELADGVEQPAQIRRVLDPATSHLEQLDRR